MAKKKRVNPLEAPIDIEGGYKLVADGAQRLSEAIDILLPALIRIEAGHGDPRTLAKSALQEFERHRGQYINRAEYMRGVQRVEAVKEGAELAAKRAAGITP